jgi:hypothetical protein
MIVRCRCQLASFACGDLSLLAAAFLDAASLAAASFCSFFSFVRAAACQ